VTRFVCSGGCRHRRWLGDSSVNSGARGELDSGPFYSGTVFLSVCLGGVVGVGSKFVGSFLLARLFGCDHPELGHISHIQPYQSLHKNPSPVDPTTRECV
jgi:hypothetical protein